MFKIITNKVKSLYQWGYDHCGYARYVSKRIKQDDINVLASSLSYTTILSLVPVLAVLLSIFSMFPSFATLREQLTQYILNNLMPQTGIMLQEYINSFIANASRTTIVGLTSLVVISLLLIRQIDITLNKIWHTTQKRSKVTTFAVYWTVLTLGPILLGISIGISSSLAAQRLFAEDSIFNGLDRFVLSCLPAILTFTILTLVFLAVPVTRVNFWCATTGALFSTIAQECVKNFFTYFILNFSSYALIYGAVAALPILMVWTYVNWLVVLVGAEIASSLQDYRTRNLPVAQETQEEKID